MTFTRNSDAAKKFFFEPSNASLAVFVFSELDASIFDLQKAVEGKYTAHYLLVFYKGPINYDLKTQDELLAKLRSVGTAIYWADDLGRLDLSASARIAVSDPGRIDPGALNLSLGQNNTNFFLSNDAAAGRLTYDAATATLVIRPEAGLFTSGVNQNNDGAVGEIRLPLSTAPVQVGDLSPANASCFSALCFEIQKGAGRRLAQPVSTYLVGETQRKTLSLTYFHDESYNAGVRLLASIKPFMQINAGGDAHSSYLETIYTADVQTNFLDEKGRNLFVKADQSTRLVSRLMPLEYVPGEATTRDYFFTPKTDEKLSLKAPTEGAFCLLGENGTESLRAEATPGTIELTFVEDQRVLLNQRGVVDGDGAGPDHFLQQNGASATAVVKTSPAAYHLDAEKSPLFKNDGAETAYAFIKKADLAPQTLLPVVPTLAFRSNPELTVLEDVFKKVRLNRIAAHQTNNRFLETEVLHITPQGFLRDRDGYDFIKRMPPPAPALGNGFAPEGEFQFRLTDQGGEIDLSLRKDQVFLVLTPELFRHYLSTLRDARLDARLDVRFGLNHSITVPFVVDLMDAFPRPSTLGQAFSHDHSVVVIKFHRESARALFADPAKWSNHGTALRGPGDRMVAAIQQAIEQKDLLKNVHDPFFQKTVLDDPNWNGVFILNVPIRAQDGLPQIFNGLAATQHRAKKEYEDLKPGETTEKLKLKTELNFSYAAFPLNKTQGDGGLVSIASTCFFGLLDYDPFKDNDDYALFSDHLQKPGADALILSKLLVRFSNSTIVEFESFAFLKIHRLFDDPVRFDAIPLSHAKVDGGDTDGIYPVNGDLYGRKTPVKNLIRLKGTYQKTEAGNEEVQFAARLNGKIVINTIINEIDVKKIGFSYSSDSKFCFDIDAALTFNEIDLGDIFSFDGLVVQNMGLQFDLPKPNPDDRVRFKLPSLRFDLSRLIVLPDIRFTGNGFLRSFPLRFNAFRNFKFRRKGGGTPDFDFFQGDFDFFKLPAFRFPDLRLEVEANLFAFVFDVDLGTLGNLDALKALRGQLLIGWSFNGGFLIGFKTAGPSSQGLHVDLFGAVKLDIDKVDLCSFQQQGASTYFLRLINARLMVFGKEFPEKDEFDFNGIIYAKPGNKIAWFIAATDPANPQQPADVNALKLGFGQRVGLSTVVNYTSVAACLADIRAIFQQNLDPCGTSANPVTAFYQPDRNWLIGSSNLLPSSWPVEIAGVFNDPVLYGIHLGFKGELLKGFSIDILYKKIADNLGVYSIEWQLPDAVRNQEIGGAFLRLPNIGIDIFTNGDWKGDVGFPRNGNDWSRSGFILLRTAPPLVGWFGFYLMASKVASLTLFKGYISDRYSQDRLQIIQAGFALRVGVGFYFDKGILYVGASLSVYGILEGAFAFERGDGGLGSLFPDHFAVQGRVGAIAELVGYVDFGIIKASVSISLRVEFGLLLVYLGRPVEGRGKGLQPVKLYVEGEVEVQVTIKIGCIKIHLSFGARVRFEFSIGGGGGGNALANGFAGALGAPGFAPVPGKIDLVNITTVPVFYLPAFSSVVEKNEAGQYVEQLLMIHTFLIPFLGKGPQAGGGPQNDRVEFTEQNILKDRILLPFLQELIEKIPQLGRYETLRHFLVTGKVSTETGEETLEIRLPNYMPTFVRGINARDKAVVSAILTNPGFGFGFATGDAKAAPDDPDDYSIINAYHRNGQNSLLAIPVPVGSKMQVVDERGARLAGFDPLHPDEHNAVTIEIQNLVNDEGGLPIVSKTLGPKKISKDDKGFIESYFDGYKTQFLTRQPGAVPGFDSEEYDLRADLLVPEFFKLAALLLLDRFHRYATDEFKGFKDANYKESDSLDPFLRVRETNGVLTFHYTYKYNAANADGGLTPVTVDKDWANPAINAVLEDVAGQLNYFYNNGLRLPLKNEATETASVYAFADLCNVLQRTQPVPDLPSSSVTVKLAGYDITRDVFAAPTSTSDPAADMRTYVNGFKPDVFDRTALQQEFVRTGGKLIRFVKPFALVPVTLAVQNSKLEDEKGARFFDLPKKLQQHGKGGDRYDFSVNYANYKVQDAQGRDVVEKSTALPNPQALPGVSVCLNVDVKVKPHKSQTQDGAPTFVLELVNVFAADLELLYTLYRDGFQPEGIDFYFKPDETADPAGAPVRIQALTNAACTVLKTNLSPRTSPPLFEPTAAALLDEGERNDYWEDSNKNSLNFIRLLWEALTTNNGGYFLIADRPVPEFKNAAGAVASQWTVTVSFRVTGATPYYFNALRVDKNADVFGGLNAKTHYLYLGDLRLNGDPVKEYHPLVPAHTLGFELTRDRGRMASPNFQNYLPLEFALFNQSHEVLSVDRVLPLMPVSGPVSPGAKEPLQVYRHLSPLIVQDPAADRFAENENRYACVGQEFTVNANVRDVFGFRTSRTDQFLATENYTHFYFDKLVPVDAWPLVRFSYWLGTAATATNLVFDLTCGYAIQEVLDLAGVARDGGRFRYNPGDPLDKFTNGRADFDLLKETIPGLLNTLYAVIAQLNGPKVHLIVPYYAGDAKQAVRDKLREVKRNLQAILQTGKLTAKNDITDPLIFELRPPLPESSLKQPLRFSVGVERDKTLVIDKAGNPFVVAGDEDPTPLSALGQAYVWEYTAVSSVTTPVAPFNPVRSGESGLTELNRQIRERTRTADAGGRTTDVSTYCLGLSSAASTGLDERTVYLINEGGLAAMKPVDVADKKFIRAKCYWGIKPFSNKLWSGTYRPSYPEAPAAVQLFSGIDLDKGLRDVLAQIDQLLQAARLPAALSDPGSAKALRTKERYGKLISAKKTITDSKLKGLLGFVDSKADEVQPSAALLREFRELLLGGLDAFYAYDGVVNTKIDARTLTLLDGPTEGEKHRLSVNLASQAGYNLVSSKIGISQREGRLLDEWSVLFDQREEKAGEVQFDIDPAVTHIEFNISVPDAKSEIEHSTWIQLLRPVKWRDGAYTVPGWPKIKREFPEKPVILKHVAMQTYADDGVALAKWDSSKAGQWRYELELKDLYDLDTDRIEVELEFRKAQPVAGFSEPGNFEGFVAYWSQKIRAGEHFPWENFVDDLDAVLTGEASALFADETEERPRFVIKKVHGAWDKTDVVGLDPARITVTADGSAKTIKVEVDRFNAFETDERKRVVSVSPLLTVSRNFEIPNERFHYETDSVKPITSATPHIRYFYPVALDRADNAFGSKVFAAIPALPFKATAKYLIDTAGKDEAGADRFPAATRNLPVIPVRQMECAAGVKPAETDALFAGYDKTNGYGCFSLTVYNNQAGDDGLAMFHAETIYVK